MLGVVLVLTIVAVLVGLSVAATGLAVAIALYSVAVSVGPRRAAVALGAALLDVTLAAVLTATVLDAPFLVVAPNPESLTTDPLSLLSFLWFALGTGWMLGRSVRARREYADQLADHRAQQAVSEERLRIARSASVGITDLRVQVHGDCAAVYNYDAVIAMLPVHLWASVDGYAAAVDARQRASRAAYG